MQDANNEAGPRASLIPCIDCGQPVSPRALLCPQCGAPLGQLTAPKQYPLLTFIAQLLKILGIIVLVIGLPSAIIGLFYGGIVPSIVILIYTVLVAVYLGLTAELISLLLDIEGNTRVLRGPRVSKPDYAVD